MNSRITSCTKALALAALAALTMGLVTAPASADTCGKAKISNVTPATSTLSSTNQFWNVIPGTTVTVTLSGVTECSGDSIQVIVQSSASGNYCTTATGSGGVYTFTYPVPLGGCQTSIISYCTTNCSTSTGYKALDANGKCPGHLRVANGSGTACTPTITGCPGTVNLGCNPPTLPTCDNAQQLGGYTVTGGTTCGTTLPVTCTAGGITTSGCTRTQIFTYTASNDCGQSKSCTAKFTWKVVSKPVFDNCPADKDLGCNPGTIPGCDTGVTAHNECGAVPVKCTKSDTSDGCTRTRTLVYTAKDACSGLSETCVQKITWKVVGAPVFDNCPGDTDLGCNPGSIPECSNTVTAHNDCGPVPVTCTFSDSAVGCVNTRTITYTAKDDCSGLSKDCVQKITWKVVGQPVFDNCPGDKGLGCNPTSIPDCDSGVTAHNECGSVPVTCKSSDDTQGCTTTRTITYTATDVCSGLSNTCVQKITWSVVTQPVFDNCPTDADLGCNPTDFPGCDEGITAHNECGSVPVTCDVSGNTQDSCGHFSRTITYTATDPCSGLSATCVQKQTWTVVTVKITCPPDANVCKEDFLEGDTSFSGNATAVDNCGNPVDDSNIDFSDGPKTDITCPDGRAGFTFIRTWTVSVCGATDICQQLITVCPCGPQCFPFGQGCTVTIGYWQTHGPGDCHKGNNKNDWPAGTITVGCTTYNTVTDAVAICGMLKSGPNVIRQLIGAQLNLLNGAKDGGAGIQTIIDAANACLCAGGDCTSFDTALENYNSGTTGPGHCGTCP